METPFPQALMTGFERVAAWADLLDEINVFPVADGDTGRNLVVSLSPLRRIALGRERIVRELLLSARGNSGNIAARFFSGLLMADSLEDLAGAVRQGRDRAWQAVNDPQARHDADGLRCPGGGHGRRSGGVRRRRGATGSSRRLEEAVLSTPELLPRLKAAGVVDAGALGVFIFLDGFFSALAGAGDGFRPVTEIFRDYLKVSPAFPEEGETGCCVDTVLRVEGEAGRMPPSGSPPSGRASSSSGTGIISRSISTPADGRKGPGAIWPPSERWSGGPPTIWAPRSVPFAGGRSNRPCIS